MTFAEARERMDGIAASIENESRNMAEEKRGYYDDAE